MVNHLKILLLMLASLLVYYIYYKTPEGPEREDLIPFYVQSISLQSHVYYACEHASRLCMITALFYASPKFRISTTVFFALELFVLADYLLRYNEDIVPGIDATFIRLFGYGLMVSVEVGRIIVRYVRSFYVKNP